MTELRSHSVHNSVDTPVLKNELEPETNHEQATPVDNIADNSNLSQPSNAPETNITEEILSDTALSPKAEFPRHQRTRLPPTLLMCAALGQPVNYHINQIQEIPRYEEPFYRT